MDQLVALTSMAKDQAGAFHSAFDSSREALASCPEFEPLWYVLARSAELGFGDYPHTLRGVAIANARAVVDLAHTQQPTSQRIAVVAARLHGDVASARDALAIDPGYEPARLAMARALLEQGEAIQADELSAHSQLPGSNTLRARILLATGKPAEAARLASRDLEETWYGAPEPFAMQLIRCDATEVLALALLAQHARTSQRKLEDAAACGSERAQEALRGLGAAR